MIGKATDFPTQTLPPGKVEISYKDKNAPDLSNGYSEFVDSSYKDFDSAYSGRTTPALWYFLNNVYQNEVPVEWSPINTLLPIERYNFGIGFNVKGK
jgi:hypothetical protein